MARFQIVLCNYYGEFQPVYTVIVVIRLINFGKNLSGRFFQSPNLQIKTPTKASRSSVGSVYVLSCLWRATDNWTRVLWLENRDRHDQWGVQHDTETYWATWTPTAHTY